MDRRQHDDDLRVVAELFHDPVERQIIRRPFLMLGEKSNELYTLVANTLDLIEIAQVLTRIDGCHRYAP